MVKSIVSLLLFAFLIPSEAFVSPRVSTRIGSRIIPSILYRKNELSRLHLFNNDENNDDNSPSKSIPFSSGLLSSVLMPAANALESADGGWVLGYADLYPETEQTLIGQAFLATNIAYTIMGLLLQLYANDPWLGTFTEIASVASFTYHYNQLARPKEVGLVRLSLMIDYVVAAACLGTCSYYLLSDPASIPIAGYVACALAILFLGLSWVWEEGLPYCINHGLWHLVGAYGGYIVGQAHAGNIIA